MKRIDQPWRPAPEQIAAAAGRRVADVIGPDLLVLFCGINPSLYSAAVGHHFARPGNRFWKALHLSGFTDRLTSPFDDASLIEHGLGITNLVSRATATAAELTAPELMRGAQRLRAKVGRYRPQTVAVLGLDAYRIGFSRKDAVVGRREETLGGAGLWILPNPSGLNAHWQLPELAGIFSELRRSIPGRARY